MIEIPLDRRHAAGIFWAAMTVFCTGLASGVLVLVLLYVVIQGIGAINVPFLIGTPRPLGISGGGFGNGILGSAIIIGIATLIATPIGMGTGIFLSASPRSFAAESIRFLNDVIAGVPSIAVGLFVYGLLVAPLGHFSGVSASVALSILMLPPIVRTTESAFAGIPTEIREGAVVLGFSRYTMITRIFLPIARPLLATGLLLAIARVSGETAPLLFTAFGNQFWEINPAKPMAELSLQIFTYAISPYREWHAMAWGGALILILVVFTTNLLARVAAKPVAKIR